MEGQAMSTDAREQLATLVAEVRGLSRRVDDGREETRERHTENVGRLDRIERKQDHTNGTVAEHDGSIVVLERLVAEHGGRLDRHHNRLNDVFARIEKVGADLRTDIRRLVGLPTSAKAFLAVLLTVLSAGIGFTYWFLTVPLRFHQ